MSGEPETSFTLRGSLSLASVAFLASLLIVLRSSVRLSLPSAPLPRDCHTSFLYKALQVPTQEARPLKVWTLFLPIT